MIYEEELRVWLCNKASRLSWYTIREPLLTWLSVGRITAVQFVVSKLRGIVTGNCHRRLVAKTLAQQKSKEIENVINPFQFALSTRSGIDFMGHLLGAATCFDTDKVVLAIGDMGAFDHIRRHSIISKLRNEPSLQALVPFVRLFYIRMERI